MRDQRQVPAIRPPTATGIRSQLWNIQRRIWLRKSDDRGIRRWCIKRLSSAGLHYQRSSVKPETSDMRVWLSLCFLLTGAICDTAAAAPDCWGVIALDASNQKVARITCSDDGAPGSAGSYQCSFTWNVRGTSGFTEPWSGTFVSSRGDKNVVRYENGNLSDGSRLDDQVDGVSILCTAQ
jgi:hypothetical protein